MKKVLSNKIFIFSVLIILLLGILFYWFAYRPSKIRHDCSWTKRIDPAKPIAPAITKEDVENSKLEYDECIVSQAKLKNEHGYISMFNDAGEYANSFYGVNCHTLLKQERPAIPATPEQVWYQEADEYEYDFCIHEKGLLK